MLGGLVRLATRQGEHEPLLRQVAVLSVYFLSAVLTGWLFRHHPIAAGALPALSVLLVAVEA